MCVWRSYTAIRASPRPPVRARRVYSTPRPSGSTLGQAWSYSFRAGSGTVRVSGSPPPADTRRRPVSRHPEPKTMVSSANQTAPLWP